MEVEEGRATEVSLTDGKERRATTHPGCRTQSTGRSLPRAAARPASGEAFEAYVAHAAVKPM